MNGFFRAAILAVFLVGAAVAVSFAATTKGGKANPHQGPVSCPVCHVAPERELSAADTSPERKRAMHPDMNKWCLECHGPEFGHGVGKRPEMNRLKLPLDAAGKITCAITCHDFHGKKVDDPEQYRYHMRLPKQKVCYSCHEK